MRTIQSRALWFFILFLMTSIVSEAQIQTPYKQKGTPTQREVDEQIANQYYRNKDFEKARDLYSNLYAKYANPHYHNLYIECLLNLEEYKDAEKSLKDFVRKSPDTWKTRIDLAYVYGLEGENAKSKKECDNIIKELPNNRNTIAYIANVFRSRGQNEYALATYEKGAKINTENYPFYIEQGYIYHSMANYEKAFECYFQHLEIQPEQYDMIKNRLQSTLFVDVNHSIADILRMALLKKVKESPDNLQFAELLIWFSLQEQDYELAMAQCKSLDRRTGDREEQILELAQTCLNNRQFAEAKDGYNYLIEKGKDSFHYADAMIGLVKTKYEESVAQHITEKKFYERLSEEIKSTKAIVGNSKEIPSLIQIQAQILTYQLAQPDQAISILNDMIQQPLSKEDINKLKLTLADIYLYKDEVWEATLLYSQVDKSMKEEPIGHEARLRNAKLRYYIGEFKWAETQLNILKAATSKLIANDAMSLSLVIKDNLEADTTGNTLRMIAKADYAIYQHKDDKALTLLDSVIAFYPNEVSVPDALFKKAEIAQKRNDFQLADSLLTQIFSLYPESYIADDALMKDAIIAQEQLGKIDKAKKQYEMLMDDYPASVYVAQARKNYRKIQNR